MCLLVENGEEGAPSPETQKPYSTLTSSLTDPAFLGSQPSASSAQCRARHWEDRQECETHPEAIFRMIQGQLSVSALKSAEPWPLFPEDRRITAWCPASD